MDYAADLNLFFEDAVSALISMVEVQVLFSDPSKNLQLFDQEVNSSAPFCTMKSSDADLHMVENGSIITIGQADYEVINVAPDGAGLSIVTLTKA